MDADTVLAYLFEEPGRAPTATGDRAAEYEAARSGALLAPLAGVTRLRLTGDDRLDFLHGQVSNTVRDLEVGGTNVALMLNHRGHALAQLAVARAADRLEVAVEAGAGELVEQSLRDHIIFDQVVVERLTDQLGLTLQGPRAPEALRALLGADAPEAGRFLEAEIGGAAVLVLPSQRSPAGGFDLHLPRSAGPAVVGPLLEAGARPGGGAALEAARIEAGLSAAGSEAGEGVLPQEAGLDRFVSYRKGCYLGQEIMARIEARGNLRRGLFGLRLGAMPPSGERDVTADGRRVGLLGGAVDHPRFGPVALAVLRHDLPEGATLEVGGVTAAPTALPFAGDAAPTASS